MKTLVIHPSDPTTDFLKVIYKDKDWSVINDFSNMKKKVIKEQIKSHDRIVFLGHGSEKGLFDVRGHNMYTSSFEYYTIIDSRWVYLLREKIGVYIWCNADMFVEKYGLKGFYTGMIISEDMEANMFNVNCSLKDIDDSNTLFADAIKNSIDTDDMLLNAKTNYTSDSNNIILFNEKNLYTSL